MIVHLQKEIFLPLAELVRISSHYRIKTANARVLTSNQSIQALQENEEQNDKQKRRKRSGKPERSRKKHKEELGRKKERKDQKVLVKKFNIQVTRQGKTKATGCKRNLEISAAPRAKRTDDKIDVNTCCTCFGLCADGTGTETEWLKCICGR